MHKTSVSKIHASDLGRWILVFGDDGQARRPGRIAWVATDGRGVTIRREDGTDLELDHADADQWCMRDRFAAPAIRALRFVLFWD